MFLAYTAPLVTEHAFAMSNTHPLTALFAVSCWMCAVLLGATWYAEERNQPDPLDRLLAAMIGRAVGPYLASPAHIVNALSSNRTLQPLLAPPSAVYCENAKRWRCPVTRKFVKTPR